MHGVDPWVSGLVYSNPRCPEVEGGCRGFPERTVHRPGTSCRGTVIPAQIDMTGTRVAQPAALDLGRLLRECVARRVWHGSTGATCWESWPPICFTGPVEGFDSPIPLSLTGIATCHVITGCVKHLEGTSRRWHRFRHKTDPWRLVRWHRHGCRGPGIGAGGGSGTSP